MDEEEAERDRLLSMLFFLVANALASSKSATKAAAQRLDIVLRPYKGIQNQADDAETALIRGLLGDLRKEENTEAVEKPAQAPSFFVIRRSFSTR